MILTQRGIDIVKKWEGLKLNAYHDPVGVVTIGYGYTSRAGFGPGVKMGDVWTEPHAEDMLHKGINLFADKIRPHFKRNATPNQFSAFVSLAYNIGWQSFIESTALRRFNAGDIEGAAEAMTWWNKADGKVLRGLVNRRADEVALFMSDASSVPAESRVTPDVERISAAKSTTVQAATAAAGGAATAAGTAVGQLDGTAQVVVIVAAAVIGLAALWIIRERLRKWASGDR